MVGLDYALKLAARSGASLHLVHALDSGSFLQTIEAVPRLPDLESRARLARTELATVARKRVPDGVCFDLQVRTGVPHDEIVHAAEKIRADLIVIATHGYSGLQHVLLGSTTERVVRHATCPVLVVRCPGKGTI